jgi:predicted alpha/beta superfamily hydrolase
MKQILLLLFCIFPACLFAQSISQVSFGQADSLHSNILDEDRQLWIYTPPLDTPYFSKASYPVVYILDGDSHFALVHSILQELAFYNNNAALPRMIIVGIPTNQRNRMRDLSPTADSNIPGSGGGQQFISFLEKELMPYINHKYSTAPYNMLIGHSLGGLMATEIMLHHPSLFNAYLAIDPSIFWNKKAILKDLSFKQLAGKKYYMAIAHTMAASLDSITVRKDTAQTSVHINAILSFVDSLKQKAPAGLQWKAKYYADEDHGSVPVTAIYDGLKYFFGDFRFPNYIFTDTSYSADSLRQLITAHYNKLSNDLGYTIKPAEPMLNGLGYFHLQQKHYKHAALFFDLNIHYYPQSSNTYDSMGDYYRTVNDTAHAADCWKKALSIKFSEETSNKLKELAAH